jgi:hypothetical protein
VDGRVRWWYGRVVPGLTGLNKARAEARLGLTAGGVEYRPGLVCEFAAKNPAALKGKKGRIDAGIDFSCNEFSDFTNPTDLTVRWTGAITPPRAGRYRLVVQTSDAVRVRVDNRLVIDTTAKGMKKDASVTLREAPSALVVEYVAPNFDPHKIKLLWVPPGASSEEAIPADHLFHDRKAEAALGK